MISIAFIFIFSSIFIYYGISILSVIPYPENMYGIVSILYGVVIIIELVYFLNKEELLFPLTIIFYINILIILILTVATFLDYMTVSGLELVFFIVILFVIYIFFLSFKYLTTIKTE